MIQLVDYYNIYIIQIDYPNCKFNSLVELNVSTINNGENKLTIGTTGQLIDILGTIQNNGYTIPEPYISGWFWILHYFNLLNCFTINLSEIIQEYK